ncbi:hypothetical protein QJS10_CPA08g00932 [Acorus calamus]|uniref:Uncharacterized protein n=1 Tax=Acorus calamus TaxID=4465 RepID=A0AAV9ECB4_ACOCL|nr:hypothetical protein QJS10_CPA08g00932 [Acorus calamus]
MTPPPVTSSLPSPAVMLRDLLNPDGGDLFRISLSKKVEETGWGGGDSRRYVVDLDFAGEFEIVRPMAEYERGNSFFTRITRLCKGLAVVLVAGYALL